jgi:hypothetical protein
VPRRPGARIRVAGRVAPRNGIAVKPFWTWLCTCLGHGLGRPSTATPSWVGH